jgi:hypothetical protein
MIQQAISTAPNSYTLFQPNSSAQMIDSNLTVPLYRRLEQVKKSNYSAIVRL